MPASSYLKGVRTRYRNCLQVEIKSGLSILQTEVPLPEHQQYVFKSSKCVEKLKLYVNKLEVQSSKVADALGEEETEEIEKVVEEDCQLCSAATDCYLELEQYKERLVEFIKQESGEKHEKIDPIQIVELQREMKDIVETQMKQQNEILIRQQMKENDESSVVIDLHYNEMINLESASNKTSSLRKFMDTLNRHLRSLEVLKQNVSQDIFVSMVKSKLPEEVLLQLEIQKESQEKWTVMSLCDKLRDYVVAREKSDKKETPKERSNGASNGSSNRAFNGGQTFPEALVATTDSKPSNISYFDKCRYCYQQHWSDECPKYQSIEERKRQLKGSCYKCLKYGHQSTDCKRNKICIHCNEKDSHHRSLCPKKFKLKLTSVHLSEEYNGNVNEECVNGINLDSYSDEGCEVVHENVFISSSEMVLMQTAKTKIGNPTNSMQQETRILFDSGSQRTYISQKLANKLKLKGEKEEEIKLITFGSDKPKIVKTSSTKLNIKLNNGKFFSIVANIVPVISGSIQRKRIDISSVEHLKHFVKDVELADDIPLRSESSSVELLIGNDYYLDLILSQRIEIQPGLYLLASKLGWILTGRSQEMDDEKTESGLLILSNTGDMMMTNHNTTDSSVSVIPDITDLWNLDSIGITEQIENVGDSKAMETFKETLQYENMRYFVKWPWKEEKYELPVNRELAMGRLKSCVARMRNKPELMTQYNSVIQDQLTKATIESHLNKYNTPTAEQIRNNIYVDNLITGANTVTDALTHYSESKQIFKDASMNLREWISNSQSVNDFILPEDKPKVNQTKVLGHLWNIENDTLSVKHSQSFINSGNITKRKTLKEISEVFDPLGLFSPILISGKIFLQDLWKKHLRWDDELQGTDSLKWGSIQTELQQLSECQISRSIGIMTGDDRVQYRLCVFVIPLGVRMRPSYICIKLVRNLVSVI
ncbi:unnamed protein product [Mytilus edulis]|uniref:CCHC-type domain-containing protein n=1 Tax=Mytilus edulis TaxID=6550 RepID=A0A8S3SFL1_MYTED|nr:unnamed protein product [Mytilus edulis]